MYCPKCAAQNIDDAKFCRACGADISFVSQALTEGTPETRLNKVEEVSVREGQAHLEHGLRHVFMGLGFLIIAIALWFSGKLWAIWMLIPGLIMLGQGMAKILSVKYARNRGIPAKDTTRPSAPSLNELPPRDTAGSVPPSVTESTTRHLGIPVEQTKKSS